MLRIVLLLALLRMGTLAHGQNANPGPEPIEISSYRQAVVFTDPLAGAAPSASPQRIAAGDTSLRRPEVTLTLPRPIQDMQQRMIERNANLTEVPGFRVQVFSGPREGAYRVESELKLSYPQQRVSVFYDRPNFKVRIGDFTSRMPAESFLRQVRASYPGAFLVPDQVKLRR